MRITSHTFFAYATHPRFWTYTIGGLFVMWAVIIPILSNGLYAHVVRASTDTGTSIDLSGTFNTQTASLAFMLDDTSSSMHQVSVVTTYSPGFVVRTSQSVFYTDDMSLSHDGEIGEVLYHDGLSDGASDGVGYAKVEYDEIHTNKNTVPTYTATPIF